jgi:CRP/FNR family cyclic AMP-dependent transcriptional regulator
MANVLDLTPLLRSISLFAGLTDEDLQELGRHLEVRRFAAGAMVLNQGDSGSSMYIVESGQCNIHLPGDASRRISLKDIARGEYFGELALFDEMPRSASVQATSDAVLLELDRDTLEGFLGRRPQVALAILRTMSERLRETNTMLSARAAKNVDEEFERNLTWSDKLADSVAELNGSWKFILGLILMTFVWCGTNAFWSQPADPYPFAFFNLALAILVGLQGPLIVMSQNRQSLKDRARADTEFKVNLKNEVNIETLLRELAEFRAEQKTREQRELEGRDWSRHERDRVDLD